MFINMITDQFVKLYTWSKQAESAEFDANQTEQAAATIAVQSHKQQEQMVIVEMQRLNLYKPSLPDSWPKIQQQQPQQQQQWWW